MVMAKGQTPLIHSQIVRAGVPFRGDPVPPHAAEELIPQGWEKGHVEPALEPVPVPWSGALPTELLLLGPQ